MNLKELVTEVADEVNFTKTDVEKVIATTFDVIKRTVANGEAVKIVRFGEIKPVYRKSRNSRNPQTGDKVVVKAKNVPVFKPSGRFREAVAKAKGNRK